MKFKIFKLQDGNFSFERNILKKAFHFLMHRTEEISVFSQTKLSDHIEHIVFHIPDEYITGTKKGGIESTQHFSQFINLFVIDNKVVFIEEIKKNYTKLILENLNSQFAISLKECIIETQIMKDCIEHYNGNVKQLDVTDKHGDIVDGTEVIHLLPNNSFASEYEIESVAFQVRKVDSNDLISLYRNGRIITDSSSERRIFELFDFVGDKIGESN